MADRLQFDLVSPERLLSSALAAMVEVPGEEGDFAVLAGHSPLMATIRPGVIVVHAGEGQAVTRIFVDGGFAEVAEGRLTVLAERAVPVSELDAEQIARDLSSAQEAVRQAKTESDRLLAEAKVTRFAAMKAALTH